MERFSYVQAAIEKDYFSFGVLRKLYMVIMFISMHHDDD